MNIKRLVGTLALSFAAFAAATCAEAGDISSIFPVNASYEQIVKTPVASAEEPLVGGDVVRFGIKLSLREATDNPWRMHYIGLGSEQVEQISNPFQLGIYVSGELTYARYVKQRKSGRQTIFYFEYNVRPGDVALPVVLAVGQDDPQPADSSNKQYRDLAYHVMPLSLDTWAIDNSTAAGAEATATADLIFKDSSSVSDPDYDLRTAGFYVRTLGFDDDEEEDAWRSVPAGTKRTGNIHVDSAPTNTATLYVWSMDESVVTVEGTKGSVFMAADDEQVRSIASIKIKEGVQDYAVTFTGTAGAAGQLTQLVLSGFPDFNYAVGTSERYVDYQTATVKVTTPPDPYMTLTDPSGSNSISIEANTNSTSNAGYTEIRLKFSKAYADGDVKVTLKQKIGTEDVPAEENYKDNRYFAILLDPDNDPTTAKSVDSVTMKAGETETRFYVFPLGTTTNLKSPGVTLVPDVSGESVAVQEFFAKGEANQKNLTIKITDQKPEVSVSAPSSGYKNDTVTLDVTVTDNWRDLQPAWNTNGYTVVIRIAGTTVCQTNGVKFTEGNPTTFDVVLPAEGHPCKGTVEVRDATHGSSSSTADFEIEVDPARMATPTFYPTSDMTSTNENLKAYEDGHYFAEGEKPYFRVTLTSEAATDMYAFLVPANAAASNCVSCAAYTNGLFIASGTKASSSATITFLDGYSPDAPMRAKFNVELRSRQDLADPEGASYASTYSFRSVELVCTNVSPTIVANSMEVNSTTVENGGELATRVPAGATVNYRARLKDPSAADLKATGDKAIITRWQWTDGLPGSKSTQTKVVTNVNGYVTCPIAFGTPDATQTISVYARDKDDLADNDTGVIDWGECVYKFTVKVSDTPHVIVSRDTAGEQVDFSFNENVSANVGYVYVQLSELPIGHHETSKEISADNPLVVELVVEKNASDGVLDFATNRVEFTNSGTAYKKVELNLNTLNGEYDSRFRITARVVTPDLNAYGQKWCDYYEQAEAFITINNVSPDIIKAKRTNGSLRTDATNTCLAGESVAIHWEISDVLPDITNGNFTITWSIDQSSDSPTANPTVITNGWPVTMNGSKAVISGDYAFSVPMINGETVVEMLVEDDDGGATSVSWPIYVDKTNPIYVHVRGPGSTSSTRYKSAKGLGQGTVAAEGSKKSTVTSFRQSWDYGESSTYAKLYAWGYPSTNNWNRYLVENEITPLADYYEKYVDNGKFPTVMKVPAADGLMLTPGGNDQPKKDGPFYDWSTMAGKDRTAGDYDSFFYRWVMINPSEDEASADSSTGVASTSASPTYSPLDTSFKNVSLDSGNEAPVEVEAVFSREMFPKDNLGDINADYVPDMYAQLYGFSSGMIGYIPEDDLASLRDYNEDKDAKGGAAPDYFPNMNGATYSTLIPSLPSSWTSGQPFTARYEIRGYGDGLNDAPKLAGLSGYEMDPNYTNELVEVRKAARDYTELEMLAWSLTGYDVEWSPECPSDPTKADTDEDGFADGYEYYFWYRAHVGDPEYFKTTGKIRRLTGRKFDPRNPGVGTVITSEEIEKAMNPRVAYGDGNGESAKLLDSDNDGLPDLLEYEIGTNPFDFDTDGDGLPDGWEIMIAGLDPLTSQTYVDGVSDTLRNLDGDAMAISSYAIEPLQSPVPTDYEHAKRWTFAVIDEDGDSSGVQWYAMADEPAAPVAGEPCTNGWKLTTVEGSTTNTFFCAYTEDHTNLVAYADADGVTRLGETVKVRKIEEHEGVAALGYPCSLAFGTEVEVAKVTAADKICSYKIAAAIASADANACWIYGKGSANAEQGEIADTAESYGCLALARQKGVPEGAEIAAFPSDGRDVAFLHYLCYQEFGFDPRTAWSASSPLTARWASTDEDAGDDDDTEVEVVEGSGTGIGFPARTRAYATYDEFLVYSFFLCNAEDGKTVGYTTGLAKAGDEVNVTWADAWYALTTNPNGPTSSELSNKANGSTTTETTTSGHYYGRSSTNGADTDGDGVPDGWELYVMAGPKNEVTGGYVFATPYDGFTTGIISGMTPTRMAKSYLSPFVDSATSANTCDAAVMGDCDTKLNEFKNFQGLDSIAVYTNVSTTVKFEPGYKWFNKFFPTDPWASDTDGDGLSDSNEGEQFYYGTFETTLVDNGKKKLFPGGGLNPCSVDTDRDGLPDPWEAQFAGTKNSIVAGKESSGYRDGMDGTVKDAYTKINQEDDDVNRDYDNDGLENWQEYLTGTMRCWRYDDPISPFDYIPTETYYKAVTNKVGDVEIVTLKFDAEHAAKTLKAAGKLETDDVNEFWYRTLVDTTSEIYNPGLVTGMSAGAQYFSRVDNPWDPVYVEPSKGGAYYWFYDRVNDTSFDESWKAAWMGLGFDKEAVAKIGVVPKKYACCSPIDPDSDHDGMDDYYELFHGMNPLLGESGGGAEWDKMRSDDEDPWCGMVIKSVTPVDLVYDSLGGRGEGNDTRSVPQAWGENSDKEAVTSFQNFWQRKAALEGKTLVGNGYDFVAFPWLNGSATADPDGDGIRNQEEAIMPLVSPTTAWHHTDPTPLWMTDASYSNSLVRMFYCLPTRGDTFKLTDATFTYPATNSVTYKFVNFGGFASTDEGLYAVAFNPDLRWPLVANASSLNYFASFEQNEGYDTDHDGLMDQDELGGKYNGKTDPLDADSPSRRQAMYFQGAGRKSILQTMPFAREYHPLVSRSGLYPDDMSFLQFTVECWVKAESLDDATIVERMVKVDRSSPDDLEYLRRNFSLGIKGGKWQALFDPNDTTKQTVEVLSQLDATTEWTHIAVTYDMDVLKIFVNGKLNNKVTSSLQPTYGSSSVGVSSGTQLALKPNPERVGMSYWSDVEYENHAIVVGAAFKTNEDGADGAALDLTDNANGFDGYKNFYKGYVDEIRIWDGARSETEIGSSYKKRFTADDAKSNRDSFYEEWSAYSANDVYRGRYSKDEAGNSISLPAELRFHWAFDSVFGGVSEDAVATAPAGFNYQGANAAGDGARAVRSRPENYEITWWKAVLDGYGSVYDDPAWICWIPNTVTHLPRYDGTTLDSFYWSDDFKGATRGLYSFIHTAEPVSLWRQVLFNAASVTAYYTTGTRYGLASGTDNTTSNTTFTTLYEFTGRHLNQCGDDLLALGGAYAKHVDEMWDSQGPSSNWEIAGNDDDGDGLPDWWERWANDHYRDDSVTGDGDIAWGTLVVWPDQNGSHITAGEAYLRDLARGYHGDEYGDIVTDGADGDFAQTADEDGNSIPDWWEKMHGIEGEDAFADHDNDGLCNLVEYILSERFNICDANGSRLLFNPTIPCSVMEGVPDYFFKVGDLYVGEIFADHDFIEDSWERQYDQSYASTLVYDAKTDNDDDGWSTFAEARYSQQVSPINANGKFHYDSTDVIANDYPVPAIHLNVKYNGSRADDVEGCSYGVYVSRDLAADKSVDASYRIKGLAEMTSTNSTVYTHVIGEWSNRHVLGTLTPGNVSAKSLRIQVAYRPSSTVYTWIVAWGDDGASLYRGTRSEYEAAVRKYGSSSVVLTSTNDSFGDLQAMETRTDSSGENVTLSFKGYDVGTVNLKSGEYDLDLGAFAGGYVSFVDATNAAALASMEDQTYRIAYSSNPSTGTPRDLYLGAADTGYVREGKNQIFVWADILTNENGGKTGEFDIGEPCGFVRDVDVGWRMREVEIEVLDHSPTLPRVKISASDASSNKSTLSGESSSTNSTAKAASSSASASELVDRGMTLSAFCATLKERVVEKNLPYDRYTNEMQKIEWMNANLWKSPEVDEDSTELTRVRIVRWALNGRPVYDAYADPEVVFDKKMRFSNRTFLTEADVLTNGVFDLDWEKLRDKVLDSRNVQLTVGNVTNVSYLVVVGEGKTCWDDASDTNSCPRILDCVLERRFTRTQPVAVPYSPAKEGSIVYAAHPTFSWTITDEDDDRYDGCTAFDIQILEADSDTVVWESGTQLLPPRDSKGRYVWAAPVYVVDDLEPSVNYRWRVSVMNAKFPTPEFDDASMGVFRIEPEALGQRIGRIPVCVRYFGPRKTILDQGLVRVEAFTSPDFTGLPAARVTVPTSEYDAVASSGSNQVAQIALTGLDYGKYYVRAYIDSAQYGVSKTLDDWESWGYYCTRDGSTAEIFSPVSVEVSSAKSGVCTIYVEDADTNGNRIPDAYEMHVNGGSLDKGTENLDETLHCGLAINTDLVTTNALDQTTSGSSDYTGYVTQLVSGLQSRAIAALVAGVEPSSIVVDASTGCLVSEATVEDGTFVITDVTFDKDAGSVTLTLDANVEKDETLASIYKLTSVLTVKVLRTATLAGNWEEVATKTFTVSGDSLDSKTVTVSDLDLNDTTGFFKVVVE